MIEVVFKPKRLKPLLFWKEKKKVLGGKKYLEVLFGKSGAYKSKNTLKQLLSKKNRAIYLKNKVSANEIVLLVQLSWRVAPH